MKEKSVPSSPERDRAPRRPYLPPSVVAADDKLRFETQLQTPVKLGAPACTVVLQS